MELNEDMLTQAKVKTVYTSKYFKLYHMLDNRHFEWFLWLENDHEINKNIKSRLSIFNKSIKLQNKSKTPGTPA